jgi:hypothetical protein
MNSHKPDKDPTGNLGVFAVAALRKYCGDDALPVTEVPGATRAERFKAAATVAGARIEASLLRGTSHRRLPSSPSPAL